MSPAELKRHVEATGSKFFTRENMKFSGDTMRNYKVNGPTTVTQYSGETCQVWELERKRAVKHGLSASAYFHVDTFEQCWPAK